MKKPLGQQNYERFAAQYAARAETKPHNAYYDRPAVLSLLPAVDGLHVLDAGCGPGIYAEWLLDHGASLVAFDVTPEMVEITQARVGDRAEVRVANLEHPLDFAGDGTFDVVVCPLVLDYIADWGPVFLEFFRVLKPGGMLVFSCGHPTAEFFKYLREEKNYFEIGLFEMVWGGFGDPKPVVRAYHRPLMDVLNPLAAAGFHLDHLLEPRPTEDYKAADPEGYAEYMREPGFLAIRAVKPA